MNIEKIKMEISKKADALTEQGISSSATIDALDKLIDMKKDLLEIEKMEMEKYSENRYSANNEYGARRNYSEGGYNEYSQGNYQDPGYQQGNYNKRGGRGSGRKYRGDDMIDEMYGAYGEYEERREQYNRGNYGAENKEIESVEYMMGCVVDFVKYLNENAHSQEVKKVIQKHIKKMQEL